MESKMTTSPHGTIARYNNQRCRCYKCKIARQTYWRDWYRRKVWNETFGDTKFRQEAVLGHGAIQGQRREYQEEANPRTKSLAEIREQQIARRNERAVKIQKMLDERK